MDDLKSCPFRLVDDEGNILCDKVKAGDRLVTADVCRACPVAEINCEHLRAALDRRSRVPILVRYGNGKTRVWDDHLPAISLNHAACAVKVMPIASPHECVGCALHRPLEVRETAIVAAAAIPALAARGTARRSRRVPAVPHSTAAQSAALDFASMSASARVPGAINRTVPPARQPAPAPAQARGELEHSNTLAKVIHLAEWLASQRNADPECAPDGDSYPMAAAAAATSGSRRTVHEEKRTGWTD